MTTRRQLQNSKQGKHRPALIDIERHVQREFFRTLVLLSIASFKRRLDKQFEAFSYR